MIFNKISNVAAGLLPEKISEALKHSATLTPDTPNGRLELDGDNLYVNISEYTTCADAEGRPETHRKYVDVQIVISGSESILWYPADVLEPDGAYDPERDMQFHINPGRPGSRVMLEQGMFAVFFPSDGHMPMLNHGYRPEPVKKAVYKIKLESLADG